MPSRSLQKQISIFLPLDDWRRVRREAARRQVPITELCRQWLRPGLDQLRRSDTDDREERPRAA
ncbi:MAG: hypothetical protein KF774_16375 [Planctomyces sp.]|nr:hypothetical protein [Planctomyces sp.]